MDPMGYIYIYNTYANIKGLYWWDPWSTINIAAPAGSVMGMKLAFRSFGIGRRWNVAWDDFLWHDVTCDMMWHVTCDMWHGPMTWDNMTTWLKTFESFEIFRDLSRSFEIFRDLSRSFEIFRDLSRSFEIFRDLSRSFEALLPKGSRKSKASPFCSLITQNISENMEKTWRFKFSRKLLDSEISELSCIRL